MNPYSNFKFAKIDATSDGANEIVAAVAGRKIRVLSYALSADAAGQMSFKSATTVIGVFEVIASNLGIAWTYGGPAPAFETAAGEALNLVTTASQDAAGHLTYILV